MIRKSHKFRASLGAFPYARRPPASSRKIQSVIWGGCASFVRVLGRMLYKLCVCVRAYDVVFIIISDALHLQARLRTKQKNIFIEVFYADLTSGWNRRLLISDENRKKIKANLFWLFSRETVELCELCECVYKWDFSLSLFIKISLSLSKSRYQKTFFFFTRKKKGFPK